MSHRSMAIAAAHVFLLSPLSHALEPGVASGTMAIDKIASTLRYASSTTEENIFDDSKMDTIVQLTEKPRGDASPTLRVRFDGNRLVNVGFGPEGENSLTLLPGQWFQSSSISRDGSGSVRLAERTSDGHTYACDVQFHAKAYVPPAPEPEPVVEAAPAPAAEMPVAQSTGIDPKSGAALLISALMTKDEEQALKLIKLGADPNGSDAYGIRVLNYAVMMYMPNVVQALVDKKADVKYERAPGMTILTEAGACPDAARILTAAGAR